MVVHIEPVADIEALAIDRQGLAGQPLDDHQRDELFREVIGPVIVRAVRHQGGQAIGVAPGPDQMVGGGLGGRIGRARIIGGLLGEEAVRPERAEHLVRGDVVEPEPLLGAGVQALPIGQHLGQHAEGARHIGLDEGRGPVDRAVHMGLGRQVGHHLRAELRDGGAHLARVADIGLEEPVAVRGVQTAQRP